MVYTHLSCMTAWFALCKFSISYLPGWGLEDGPDTEEDEDVAAERVRILGTPSEKLWESDSLILRWELKLLS